MSLNLNSTVRIVSKTGAQQRTSIREVIKLGSGKAYEGLIMLDEWPSLLEMYEAEMADPMATITERVRIALKECQKALWWAEVGLYKNARVENRDPTAEDAMEAGGDYKEAQKKLTNLYMEQCSLFQQGHQPPATAALVPIAEQQSNVYLNTRSRSIWI